MAESINHDKVHSSESKVFSYTMRGIEYLISIRPIMLKMDESSPPHHAFSFCFVLNKGYITRSIDQFEIFKSDFTNSIILTGTMLLISISLGYICIKETSETIVRPFRELNGRLKAVIRSKDKSAKLQEGTAVCAEITELYSLFNNILTTYKFQNNDFMNKSDEMAIIDLADACSIF